MKKLKSIDFKALFVNHGEKFGLAVIVMIVLLALGRTSWSRYAGTPEDLDKKAKDARQRFSSLTGNPWPKEKAESFKVVDFNDRANQLFARLDLPRFGFSTEMFHPLYRKRELAREPEYLPVEYLIAHAGRAILGVSRAGSTTDSTIVDSGTGTTAEAAAPTGTGIGFKPSGPSGAAAGGIGAPDSAAPAAGAAHAPPGAKTGAAGAHGDAMYGSSMMPGAGGASSGVAARGVRYVAVRGVFQLQQQMEKYVRALHVMPAEASTMFELLDFVLERQAAVAGPNPWDTKWETVNVESALEVLREVSDFDLDPVQTGVTDSVITMSLPYRLLEFWGDHATHPNVRDFQLKPEDMERELKLQEKLVEEYEKAKLKSEPKVKRRGLSAGQNDLRQMGQQMMASPSGAHDMPGMSNMPNSNMMSGLMGSMNNGAGSAGATPMSAAEIKQRLTANGRLLLFRYFDFDVQPGLAYRYRVKLVIRNPNFERAAAEVVDPALVEGAERETDWSNISMPAVVPTSINYFLKDVERDPSRDDKVRPGRPVANISMFEWDTKLGTMLHDTLKILAIGQFISEKKKTIVVDVATRSYNDNVEVAFLTGDVLLDASGDFDIAPEQHPDLGLRTDKGRPSVKLGLLPEAIVMTGLGEMKELNPAADKTIEQALKQRVDAERNEVKKLKDAGAKSGGALDGASAYGGAMAGMSSAPGMQMPPSKKNPKKKGASSGSSSSSGGSPGANAAPDTGGKSKPKRSMPPGS